MKIPIINVSIEGKSATLGLDEKTYQALEPLFRYHPPGYQYSPKFKLWKQIIDEGLDIEEFDPASYWDGWVRMLKETGWCPAQLFRASQSMVEKKVPCKFKIINEDCKPVLFKALGKESDRSYQNECVDKMLVASAHGGGLILAATGSGKTYTLAVYFSYLDGNAVFIVDELALMRQAQMEIEKGLNEPVGIIGNSRFEPRRITVATVQSLYKHSKRADFRKWRDGIDVAVVDELHKALNRRHFSVVRSIPAGAVFGLTATLRLGKRHTRMQAYALCGPVVFQYPIEQGTQEGFLTRGRVIQVEHRQRHESRKRDLRSYQLDYDWLIVQSESRNELIADIVHQLIAKGKYVVVLVERIHHLKTLSEMFRKIPHRVIFGKVKGEERLDAVRDFERDDFRLILANVVFNKGIDIKRLDAIVNGAAKRNPDDALQAYGRGVRLHKDKKMLLYYDVRDVGNRFEAAANERKRAFEKAGIEVRIRKVA
jgi:superfamily II DNA or RNA helicase